MSDSERLKEMVRLEGLKNLSRFSTSIGYSHQNISNYTNGRTKTPTGDLIIAVCKKYPHWNIRYWLFGEGKPFLEEGQLSVITNYEKDDKRVQQLLDIVEHMKDQIERKDSEIDSLKKQIEGLESKIK